MRKLTALVALLAWLAPGARGGEGLTPEASAPLHDGRDAYQPAAAFGGDVFLLVWQSGRFGEGDLRKGFEGLGIADIVGCRIGRDGKPLDGKPFVISGAKDLQQHAQVAFGDGQFLVVWHDLRNGKDWDVFAARISAEGKVLDADGVLVAGGAHNQACPRVAWDGKAFCVVWQDFRSNRFYEAYGARVSPEGKVLDAGGVLLGSGIKGGYHCYSPAVTSSGGGKDFALWVAMGWSGNAWKDPPAAGVFLAEGKAAPPIVYKEKDHGPGRDAAPACLAAGPKTYLAAWRTDSTAGRGNAPGKSTAMILDAEGKSAKRLFLAGKAHRIQAPDAAWDGSAYVAAWHETRLVKRHHGPHHVVFASRVSEAGDPVGAVETLSGSLESPAAEPAVASDGAGTTLVAYEKHPATGDAPIRIAFRMLRAE